METRYSIESQGAPLDEPSLVDRARHDPDAFGELYERYCDRINRFASTRLKGCVDAEDLTAEVFFRAFRGIKTYRNAGRPFGAWLFRIEINALAERSRRQRTTVPLDEVADLPDYHRDVVDHVLHRERMRSIWTAVRGLTPQQRRAITLRFAADLPVRTIAQAMQKSPDAVKLLVSRGVRRLREQLGDADFLS